MNDLLLLFAAPPLQMGLHISGAGAGRRIYRGTLPHVGAKRGWNIPPYIAYISPIYRLYIAYKSPIHIAYISPIYRLYISPI